MIGTPDTLRAGKKEEAVADSKGERISRRRRMLRDRVNDLSMMERARRGSTEERGKEEATVESEIEETGVIEEIGGTEETEEIGEIGTEITMKDVETVMIEEIEGIEETGAIGEIAKTVDNGNIVENVIAVGVSPRRGLRGSSRRRRIR